MSFCTVPRRAVPGTPCPSATSSYSKSSNEAGALIVIDVENLIERKPVEEVLHVDDQVDRDAGTADLAQCHGVVEVVAELFRQVKCDGQLQVCPCARRDPVGALVRLLGRGESGVLAHRPRPAPVHVRVRPAG